MIIVYNYFLPYDVYSSANIVSCSGGSSPQYLGGTALWREWQQSSPRGSGAEPLVAGQGANP